MIIKLIVISITALLFGAVIYVAWGWKGKLDEFSALSLARNATIDSLRDQVSDYEEDSKEAKVLRDRIKELESEQERWNTRETSIGTRRFQPQIRTVTKLDTILLKELPIVQIASLEVYDNQSKLRVAILAGDSLLTIEAELPARGDIAFRPEAPDTSITGEITTQVIPTVYVSRWGKMFGLGAGVSSFPGPSVSLELAYVNQLWFTKNLRLGLQGTMWDNKGHIGGLLGWKPFPRRSPLLLYVSPGVKLPVPTFQVVGGVQVELWQ